MYDSFILLPTHGTLFSAIVITVVAASKKITLLVASLFLMFILMVCVLCCCKNTKNTGQGGTTVFGRMLLSRILMPPPFPNTTQDPEGIIQPDVMFYTRPSTQERAPSVAVVAHALPPPSSKDRITTPLMPLNPAYQPPQPVTVTTTLAVPGSNELTLPPGYVANREVKYR